MLDEILNGMGDDLIVTLTLDDNEEVDCGVVGIVSVGEQEYISLCPLDKDGNPNEEGQEYIYRFAMVDGEPSISPVESDEEFEKALDSFDEWLDNLEFDEMQNALNKED